MSVVDQILAALDRMAIQYELVDHPAAHTIEDCADIEQLIGAMIPKNLFLTPRNQSRFFLCLVHPHVHFRTAEISKQIGSSRLSFGPSEKMDELLNTFPGAVSPLGLIFPSASEVQLLIDGRLRAEKRLAFHPNDNTKTLAMTGSDFFEAFLPATGHNSTFITVNEASE